jgi:hypothetical protein
MIDEVLKRVTVVRSKCRDRSSPGRWVRVAFVDVSRNSGPVEAIFRAKRIQHQASWRLYIGLTNSNAIFIPLHREDTTSLGFKEWAIGCLTPFCNTASRVGRCKARAIKIVCAIRLLRSLEKVLQDGSGGTCHNSACEIGCRLLRQHTAISRVPCHLIMLVVVHTLNDIDLAMLR